MQQPIDDATFEQLKHASYEELKRIRDPMLLHRLGMAGNVYASMRFLEVRYPKRWGPGRLKKRSDAGRGLGDDN
jgi:hypothetical protein